MSRHQEKVAQTRAKLSHRRCLRSSALNALLLSLRGDAAGAAASGPPGSVPLGNSLCSGTVRRMVRGHQAIAEDTAGTTEDTQEDAPGWSEGLPGSGVRSA